MARADWWEQDNGRPDAAAIADRFWREEGIVRFEAAVEEKLSEHRRRRGDI